MPRLYFVAGESSGDMHGAHVIRALRARRPDVICEGLGGRRMAEAGMELHFDLAGRAIMGFTEVIRSLRMVRGLYLDVVKRLRERRPDAVVLIDYPGFNMRIAAAAHAMGIPVVYYISPQVWAWKRGRIRTLARIVTRMLVILPFEEELYREAGLPCVYVGHPLLDQIAGVKVFGCYRDAQVVGLLPGSREQEIRRLLPVMIKVAEGIRARRPEVRFVAPCVDGERAEQIRKLAGDFPLETIMHQAYEVLDGARLCLVASGTATLETALFGTPMIVMYRISGLSYALARMLVRIRYISLVNILAGRGIVPEFIQGAAQPMQVLPVALELLEDGPRRETMLRDLAAVRELLGEPGASEQAAEQILEVIEEAANAPAHLSG